jgi:hypothetical protein
LTPEQVTRWLALAHWRVCRDLDRRQFDRLLAASGAALAAGPAPRKRERHKLIFELALAGTQPDHLLKVEQHRHASLVRRLGPAAAVAQLAVAESLAARGLENPVPIAAGTVRRRGLLDASLLLVPIVPDAIDVAALWRDASCPNARRRLAARDLGALARSMHDAGVDQEDFAPNNFLWRPAPRPRILAIDFERARVGRPLGRRARAQQLAKLDRYLHAANATDRLRLLHAYARGNAQSARGWWHAVEDAHRVLARRDFRHLLRTGTRASRRFAPVSRNGWRGWARRNAALEAQLEDRSLPADSISAGCWVQSLGSLDRHAAARAWAAALTLAQRGCSPEPLGLLAREDRGWLVFEREPGSRVLADVDRETGRAALLGLCSRLLHYGFEPAELSAETIRLAPGRCGTWRASLLDPRGLRAGRRSLATSTRARAWSAAILGARDAAPDRA